MDVSAAFVAHAQPPKALEPSQGALDHPAVAAQTGRTVLPAPSDACLDAPLAQRRPAASVVITFVGVQLLGPAARSASRSGDGRHRVDGCFEHPRVMHVGGRKHRRQGQAAAFYHNVALRARTAAIDRICAGFLAPFCAGTEHESKAARLQSSLSASASLWGSTQWSTSHTPAACQSRSRRQHVIPEPQPISGGSNSHGVPVRNTKTMPVSTARSGMRGLPPRGRGGIGGSNGSTSSQSLSLTSGLAIRQTYQKTRFC